MNDFLAVSQKKPIVPKYAEVTLTHLKEAFISFIIAHEEPIPFYEGVDIEVAGETEK